MIRARYIENYGGGEVFRFAASLEAAEKVRMRLLPCGSIETAEIVPLGHSDTNSLLWAAREREAAYAREKAE